nr:hypothetical protein [Tanacetum cinerariifolium]
MTSLADKAILPGADNHPPMLEKDMYDSWKSRMELYMLNRQHGRMILESVKSGPLFWPTIEENEVTRLKKYSELLTTEAIQADCNVKATNIILQGLPLEKERECKLYDEFDKFAYKKGESLRDFYLRFSLLLNDMNIYNIKLEQFQVNTKFLNTLPPEWSKFVTDVKLVRDLHTTNVDQLHAYLEPSSTPLSLTYPSSDYQSSVNHNEYNPKSSMHNVEYAPAVHPQSEFSPPDTRIVVPIFQKGSSRTSGKQRVIVSYNCKGEGHMSKQCTKPKRRRYKQWLKDKSLEIEKLKHTLSEHLKEKESLEQKVKELNNSVFKRNQSAQTVHMLTKPQFFYDHFTRQALGFQNPCYLKKAQKLKPKLYDGSVIEKCDAIVIHDSEETLLLAEESQVPKELPKVSMVNSSLKKLKFQLASFDMVVKERTTATAITKGTNSADKTVNVCERCVPIETELQKNFINKECYDIDGTLNDVRNALDDRPKGIRMQNFPQTIWRKGNKDRAAAMIQVIDKMLKTEDYEKLETVCWRTTMEILLESTSNKLMVDLQLGVESYKKRLNLTKPYTYRSDLKRREAYTAYSNPRGFIYQNKEKKNRLMRIDELHKFSDGTLNDVRNGLDDRLKGIRMQYLPQTIWRKGVNLLSSASRSQPQGNTKKDKIQRPPSNTQKNKVKAHPRTVKSSLKNNVDPTSID